MKIVRGDTKDFYVLVTDTDGNIFNLTGYSMTFTVRSSYETVDTAIEATAIITTPTSGRGDFTIPKADTDIFE